MHSFKKALAASASFLLCLALLLAILIWPYFHGQAYFYEDAPVRDELAGSLDTLISGASHGLCAFDCNTLDAELGTCSYNLSGSLMTMRSRKLLLQKELDRNPVKTVFIELSCNALLRDRVQEGPEGDLYAMARLGSFSERVRFFFQSFTEEEYLSVLSDTIDRGITAWKALLKGEASPVDASERGFLARDSADLSMTAEDFVSIHNQLTLDTNAQWDNKQALQDMVKLCQERGIEVVFVATPLSDQVLAQYSNLETPYGWFDYYAKEFGCPFLDFNLYRERDTLFPDDSAFYDSYHLSESGAETFTRELAELYTEIKNGEDVSSLFYQSYYELDLAMTEAYAQP